jgi:fatty acid desaturase
MTVKSIYRTQLDKATLKSLHERSDLQGYIRVLTHIVVVFCTGYATFVLATGGKWYAAIVVLIFHGALVSFLGWAGASHELSHYSVFRTRRLNALFLYIFSTLLWNNWAYFRRTHSSHHRYTLDSQKDDEVRSNSCWKFANEAVRSIFDVRRFIRVLILHIQNALGRFPVRADASPFPESDQRGRARVAMCSRITLLSQGILICLFLSTGLYQLIIVINLSPFIGNGLANLLASAQHCGKLKDTADLRMSTRTVLLNPVLSFLYWNMNYHIEHHMYPGVPCYNLPKLRALVEDDLPTAPRGLFVLIKEMRELNLSEVESRSC